jgi:hypothetical protein
LRFVSEILLRKLSSENRLEIFSDILLRHLLRTLTIVSNSQVPSSLLLPGLLVRSLLYCWHIRLRWHPCSLSLATHSSAVSETFSRGETSSLRNAMPIGHGSAICGSLAMLYPATVWVERPRRLSYGTFTVGSPMQLPLWST